MSEANSMVLCFENCHDVSVNKDKGGWQDSGKSVPMRWLLPNAVVDLEEEQHDKCKHYVVTIEFSSRHYEWNCQRLRFGTSKEDAVRAARDIVNKLAQWPLFVKPNKTA